MRDLINNLINDTENSTQILKKISLEIDCSSRHKETYHLITKRQLNKTKEVLTYFIDRLSMYKEQILDLIEFLEMVDTTLTDSNNQVNN